LRDLRRHGRGVSVLRRWRHGVKSRRLLLGAAWLGAVGAASFVTTSLAAGAAAPASASCGPFVPHNAPSQPGTPMGSQPVIFRKDDASIFMRFDDSRRPRALGLLFTAIPPVTSGTKLWTQLDYLRSTDGDQIAGIGDGLRSSVGVTDTGGVEVCLAMNPHSVVGLHPGRFKGTLVVGGDVQPLSLPVEVTFRAARSHAVLVAFLGVLLGLIVKVLSEAAAARPATGDDARRALRTYVSQLTFPVTLIFAAIAGWLGFVHIYDLDPDWGASSTDAAKLFAVCFLAQLSSVQAIELVKAAAGGATAGQQPPATGTG
jgi:hypothetical protein